MAPTPPISADAVTAWLREGESLFDANEMLRVRGLVTGLLMDRHAVMQAAGTRVEAKAARAALASLTLDPAPLSEEEVWRAQHRHSSVPVLVRELVERHGAMHAVAIVERARAVSPDVTSAQVFSALYRLSGNGGPLLKTGRRALYLYAPRVAAVIPV